MSVVQSELLNHTKNRTPSHALSTIFSTGGELCLKNKPQFGSYMQNQTMDGITHSSGHPTWSSPSLTPSPAYCLTQVHTPWRIHGLQCSVLVSALHQDRWPSSGEGRQQESADHGLSLQHKIQKTHFPHKYHAEMLWLFLLLTSPPPSSYTSTPSLSPLSYTCTHTHTASPPPMFVH